MRQSSALSTPTSNASRDSSRDSSRDASIGASRDASRGSSRDASIGASRDASRDSSRGSSSDASRDSFLERFNDLQPIGGAEATITQGASVTASFVYADQANPQKMFFYYLHKFNMCVNKGIKEQENTEVRKEANTAFSNMLKVIEDNNLYLQSNVIRSILRIASDENLMKFLLKNNFLTSETIGQNSGDIKNIAEVIENSNQRGSAKENPNLITVIAKMLYTIRESRLLKYMENIRGAVIKFGAANYLFAAEDVQKYMEAMLEQGSTTKLASGAEKETPTPDALKALIYNKIRGEIDEIDDKCVVDALSNTKLEKSMVTQETRRAIYAALKDLSGENFPENPIDGDLDLVNIKKRMANAPAAYSRPGSGTGTPNTADGGVALKKLAEDINIGDGLRVKIIINEIIFHITEVQKLSEAKSKEATNILNKIKSEIMELPKPDISRGSAAYL